MCSRCESPDAVYKLLVIVRDQDVWQGLSQAVHVSLRGILLQHFKQLLLHIRLLPKHILHLTTVRSREEVLCKLICSNLI